MSWPSWTELDTAVMPEWKNVESPMRTTEGLSVKMSSPGAERAPLAHGREVVHLLEGRQKREGVAADVPVAQKRDALAVEETAGVP